MSEQVKLTMPAGHSIEAAFSGTETGNMDSRFGPAEEVTRNRGGLYSPLGLIASKVAWMKVEGGRKIIDIDKFENPSQKNDLAVVCDGLITTKKDQGLALFPADCVPMLIYSSGQEVLGLLHVGRTGAEQGIHTAAVRRLTKSYGVDLADIRVYFGPSIQPESYRYDYLDPTLAGDKRWTGHMQSKDGRHYLDLPGFIKDELFNQSGLSPSQIVESASDTGAEDSAYFSHRRSQLTGEAEGRNGVVAVMRAS